MKLQFLGTAAAEGFPAVFCRCAACQTARERGEKEFRSRAQYLIDERVGIDFPSDGYLRAEKFGVDLTKMQYLLITHSHFDHFYAHEFVVRGYKYTQTQLPKLYIFGNEEVGQVFDECTKRELRDEVRANICVQTVAPFVPFTFGENNEYTATALPAQHSAKEQAYVYLLEKDGKSYLHLCDTGRLPLQTLDYLQKYFSERKNKIDLITFDCTFLFHTAGNVSRHMGLEDNKAMLSELCFRGVADEKTRCVITHFSHNSAPLTENISRAEKEYGYIGAYDGLLLNI